MTAVDVYYRIDKNSKIEDLIAMNINKPWTSLDYLNYYCKNGFPEYLKLEKFLKESKIKITLALGLTMGKSLNKYHNYKIGKYKFPENMVEMPFDKCFETIECIKKVNGFSTYTSSAKFWTALIKFLSNPEVDFRTWISSLIFMGHLIGPRINSDEYYKSMMDIYNRHNPNKIS